MNILLAGSFGSGESGKDADKTAVPELAAWQHALQTALPGHRVLVDRTEVDEDSISAAIVANPPPGMLQGLPNLQLIQSLWAGVDRLLADPTLPPGVPIARMVDPMMNRAMAETALWATLALHRGFFGYQRRQAEGRWQVHPQHRAEQVPVLVLGCGQMGRSCAQVLAQQGYPVTGWRRIPSAAGPLDECAPWIEVSGESDLLAQLARTRVLINLLPLTPVTRGIIDARLLAALPRGAGIVNLARGAHVVDDDLIAALDAGQIGHAVLDVFHVEPLPADHRFWRHPSVSLLPHAAALTDRRSAAGVAAANIQALAAGRPVAHLVARDVGY